MKENTTKDLFSIKLIQDNAEAQFIPTPPRDISNFIDSLMIYTEFPALPLKVKSLFKKMIRKFVLLNDDDALCAMELLYHTCINSTDKDEMNKDISEFLGSLTKIIGVNSQESLPSETTGGEVKISFIMQKGLFLDISEDEILFSPELILHMKKLLNYTKEIQLNHYRNLKGYSNFKEYIMDDSDEDDSILLSMTKKLSCYFGKTNKNNLVLALSTTPVSAVQNFDISVDQNNYGSLSKNDSQFINKVFNEKMIGTYRVRYIQNREGTSTEYIGEKIDAKTDIDQVIT